MFLVLAISIKQEKIPLWRTIGTPAFGGANVTTFIVGYEIHWSYNSTNLAGEDCIPTFPYYCVDTIQETVLMMNGYLRKDLQQLKEELKDAFWHTVAAAAHP